MAIGRDEGLQAPPPDAAADPARRREELKALFYALRNCPRCPQLARARSKVVFGAGNANAQLMFVGEAPGAREDEAGLPFVGRAGQLLERLLGGLGLAREDVFIANVLKCRPPGNRDPLPVEVENCKPFLLRQIALVQPSLICTLGNFATKLLRGGGEGITRLHGKPEVIAVAGLTVRIYPLYHPAAALRSPALEEVLRQDFGRIPTLLAEPPPAPPAPPEVPLPLEESAKEPKQLGLF